MNIVAIVQARMASSRLPGKVLADLAGRPVLWRVVERVRQARRIDEIVVATSTESGDDAIAALRHMARIVVFRGSENDVLDRVVRAAHSHRAEAIVRITADCPLIDPDVIDRVVETFTAGEYDYVSNVLEYTYPNGLDVEVARLEALERAWREATKPSDREHVTSFLRFSNRFRSCNVAHDTDLSHHRWTLDEPDDLDFIRRVYEALGDRLAFRLADILDLLAKRPDLRRLPSKSVINEGYYKSLYSQAEAARASNKEASVFIDYTRPSAAAPSHALGRRLQDGFNALARQAGMAHRFACVGDPTCSELRCEPCDRRRFQEEAARRGILIGDQHHLSPAHDMTAIEETLFAYAAVLKTLALMPVVA